MMIGNDVIGDPRANRDSTTDSAEERAADPIRVCHYQFFPGGGIGRYTHEMLTRLSRRTAVDAELVCLPSFHWRHAAGYRVWPGLREITHPWPLVRKSRFLVGQYANPRRLCRRLRDVGAEIVHFANVNHLTYPLWRDALARTGAKVVATVHDVRRAKAILHRGHEDRQLRRFYREADALFVHGSAQRDDLVAFADCDPTRIHTVYHGPSDYGRPTAARSELRSRFGLEHARSIGLAFGQIRDEKNLDLLLQALRTAPSGVHLVVAGSAAGGRHRPMEYYRRLAEELGVRESVTWMDEYIADERVPDLFEAADWIALPYSASFTSQSGVLNVAVNYDRPALVSATATLRETLGHCDVGVLVQPDDVDSLATGIVEILDRCERGDEFAFEEYRGRFGWDETVRRTIDVYERLARPASQTEAAR